MATKKAFEQFVSHTVRIELKNGITLHYDVTADSKAGLREQFIDSSYHEFDEGFIWFHIPEDRLVIINRNELIRVTFLFEMPDGEAPRYRDNFNANYIPEDDILEEMQGEKGAPQGWDLPQLIIMHNRQLEDSELVKGVTMKSEGFFGNISFYTSLTADEISGLYFNNNEDEFKCLLSTEYYLQFEDDDGEENFMPLNQICLIEISRAFVMSDLLLNLYLGRKPRKRKK